MTSFEYCNFISQTCFTRKAFCCSHGYCFQIGFVVMETQRVLENNTNPFTCSKSNGTESIIIPSENLKGQGKKGVTS